MTLHLSYIRCADHPRADVRVARRTQDETNDKLRDEIGPVLRWPIHDDPDRQRRYWMRD